MYNSDVSTGGCIVICVILAVLSFLEAWVVQLLWNWIAPIFWQTAPILTYWQAFGCCILLSIIGSAFRSISK
jgi:hypothetical protein